MGIKNGDERERERERDVTFATTASQVAKESKIITTAKLKRPILLVLLKKTHDHSIT